MENRRGAPLDIDEAGYMTASFALYDSLETAGLQGLWSTFQQTGSMAPLTPLLTVPIHLLHGKAIVTSFLVQQLFAVLLVVTVYLLTRSAAGRRDALVATFAVASTPAVLDFSRSYQFVTGSTALYAAAVWAFIASDGLIRKRYAALSGIFLGLTLLNRTMMVSFVPAFGLAAFLILAFGPNRARRLAGFMVALICVCTTAGIWYFRNWRSVYDYLTSFGYGDRSDYYGESTSIFSLNYWFIEIRDFILYVVHLPLATTLAAIFLLALITSIRRAGESPSAQPSGSAWRAWLISPPGLLTVILAVNYIVLSTSKNQGTGFAVPLAPLVIVLAVIYLRQVRRRTRIVLLGALMVVSIFNFVSHSANLGPLSQRRTVDLPGVPAAPITDGQSYLVRYLRTWSALGISDKTVSLPSEYSEWIPTYQKIVHVMARHEIEVGNGSIAVGHGLRDPLMNPNTINLANRLYFDRAVPQLWIETLPSAATASGYRDAIESSGVGIIITGDELATTFPPAVDQFLIEQAAVDLGFIQTTTIRLPDGRKVKLHWRS